MVIGVIYSFFFIHSGLHSIKELAMNPHYIHDTSSYPFINLYARKRTIASVGAHFVIYAAFP